MGRRITFDCIYLIERRLFFSFLSFSCVCDGEQARRPLLVRD